MANTLDLLLLRRPRIDYVSPPICEFDFSSTSTPVIVLSPFSRQRGPTGPRLTGDDGVFILTWDDYPGALCYTIYKALDSTDPFGEYEIVAECVTDSGACDPFPCFNPPGDGCYKISAITPEGETELSDFVCFDCDPAVQTDPASNIITNAALLNGTGNPSNQETVVFFEWGLTTAYGNTTLPQSIGEGTDDVSFDEAVFGLSPNTTYHFRAVADNICGTVEGEDQQFTTQAPAGGVPVVTLTALTDPEELGPIAGEFVFERSGASIAADLIVQYAISGSAVNGTDYETISGFVTILAGESSVAVEIVPIYSTEEAGNKTVTLVISPNVNYTAGSPSGGTLTIQDTTYTAPPSLFESPGVLLGAQSFTIPSPSSFSWAGQPIGIYTPVHAGGAFQTQPDRCLEPVNPSSATWENRFLLFNTSLGASGELAWNNVVTFQGCGGEFTTGFATEALAVAEYIGIAQPQIANFGANGTAMTVSFFSNSPTVPGGSVASFNLLKQELIAPEPNNIQVVIDTYANGRWQISYNAESTGPLTFAATAGDVQTALNAVTDIASAGGVVVTGDATNGFVVTWNSNGLRNALNPVVSTKNPGILCSVSVVQLGTVSQPDIQTITVGACPGLVASGLPEWDGSFNATRELNVSRWTTGYLGGTNSMNNGVMYFGYCRLRHDVPPEISPDGHGWQLLLTQQVTIGGGINLEMPVWSGFKAGGDDPTGEYTWLNYAWGFATNCVLDQTHGVQKLVVNGTF